MIIIFCENKFSFSFNFFDSCDYQNCDIIYQGLQEKANFCLLW